MEKEAMSNLGSFINVHAILNLQLDVEIFYVILFNLCQLSILSNYWEKWTTSFLKKLWFNFASICQSFSFMLDKINLVALFMKFI